MQPLAEHLPYFSLVVSHQKNSFSNELDYFLQLVAVNFVCFGKSFVLVQISSLRKSSLMSIRELSVFGRLSRFSEQNH